MMGGFVGGRRAGVKCNLRHEESNTLSRGPKKTAANDARVSITTTRCDRTIVGKEATQN